MSSDGAEFVRWFRSSAPYIHAHRGRTFVLVMGGEIMEGRGLRALVQDVALLQSLGIRVVLAVGARPQIDARLARRGVEPRFKDGLRITDSVALDAVKEAAGTNRVELEQLLSMGLPSSPMEGARVRVLTGNFVTARPVGVIDGVDYGFTGRVRRVDADAIRRQLDSGSVVVLTPIAYSITGEAFNVSTHEMAAATAIALGADKLICLVEGKGVVDGRGRVLPEMSPDEAEELLSRRKRLARDVDRNLRAAIYACRKGVDRAHLIPRKRDGAILHELFTRDGIGTLVSQQRFEGIRKARPGDVQGILQLIEPLERAGVLVRRSREMLESDLDCFSILERDGMVIGCTALYPHPEWDMAELACVVVHSDYRHAGRAEALLAHAEKTCRGMGLRTIFVLTTQTTHWFRERGFEPGSPKKLPKPKRARYDRKRRSKVLFKAL